jgi:Uma2 family endonuclease
MSIAIKNDRKYTFEDYLTWNDGKRWEIIDGVAYLMSPMPTLEHQEISGNLFLKIRGYLQGKKCQVFHPPFDVRLSQQDENSKKASSTVQPDITVICDRNKLDSKGCKGAPDLIIEILSPSTSKHDTIRKYNLYERNAVREYWIVDPSNQIIERFSYDDSLGKYKQIEYFARESIISPIIFPDLQINLEEIFPEIIEEYEEED